MHQFHTAFGSSLLKQIFDMLLDRTLCYEQLFRDIPVAVSLTNKLYNFFLALTQSVAYAIASRAAGWRYSRSC
ncbi:MAG TPA: hypothetical protein PKA53_04990 [Sphingobacterium sp.]|nr:hypothetical protein [Sphingobacterium sp.]